MFLRAPNNAYWLNRTELDSEIIEHQLQKVKYFPFDKVMKRLQDHINPNLLEMVKMVECSKSEMKSLTDGPCNYWKSEQNPNFNEVNEIIFSESPIHLKHHLSAHPLGLTFRNTLTKLQKCQDFGVDPRCIDAVCININKDARDSRCWKPEQATNRWKNSVGQAAYVVGN